MNKFVLFLLFFAFALSSLAQKSPADRYYKSGNYPAAIQAYEKQMKKDSSISCARNLADCYVKIRKYESGEAVYRKVILRKEATAGDFYNYGLVLKCNSNYALAMTQFDAALNLDKDNLKALEQKNYCKEHLNVEGINSFFKVSALENINSSENDNAPCLLNKSIYYSTAAQSNNLYASPTDGPVFSIFKKDLAWTSDGAPLFAKAKTSAAKVNPEGNNGVASFSDSTQTLFFTHVDKTTLMADSGAMARPGIYFSVLKNSKWSDPLPFQWNNVHYSFEHPAISANGKYLIFVSDMPGGFGKTDLYGSEWKDGSWSKPVNLGAGINTAENEVFPYQASNGVLYFSSDGRVGSGGLDIFRSVSKNNVFRYASNMGTPINSGRDDFGICFLKGDSVGLISSNRTGGAGGDDIYFFKRVRKYATMQGRIFLDKELTAAGANRPVSLYDQDGSKVDQSTTDDKGFFRFAFLNPENSYTVELDENDNDKLRKLYLTDTEKRKIAAAAILKNKARFKVLEPDLTKLKELEDEDPAFYIGLTLLKSNTTSTPMAGVKVNLVNAAGKVTQSTTTNTFGAFAFRHITDRDTFRIVLDNEKSLFSSKDNFVLTNLNGEKVQNSSADKAGQTVFDFNGKNANKKLIAKVEPSKLYKNFAGILSNENHVVIQNTKVTIQNESGTIKQECKTDNKGYFAFKRLPVDENYFMSLDEDDVPLAKLAKKVIITDLAGNIILEVDLRQMLKDRFKILPSDASSLTDIEVDDPWLQVLNNKKADSKDETVTIRENLFYPVNEWKASPEAKVILNKVLQVMNANPALKIEISSHTDSRGSDQYNLALSVKRANAAMEYLLQNGVKASRLKAIGYGEQKPLNRCVNDVDCSDEEFSKNRRTEFKVVY
jgi:outer membrane protein OmpA-like peptidoglycan-associated protein